MTNDVKLTEHQQRVLKAFVPSKLDVDIDIVVLYTRVYGDPGSVTVRKMQQKLAPTFRVINKRMLNLQIILGDLKRTYRLTIKV